MQAQDMVAGNWYVVTTNGGREYLLKFSYIEGNKIMVDICKYLGTEAGWSFLRLEKGGNKCFAATVTGTEAVREALWVEIDKHFPEYAINKQQEYQIY